jgi:hypothetical protein
MVRSDCGLGPSGSGTKRWSFARPNGTAERCAKGPPKRRAMVRDNWACAKIGGCRRLEAKSNLKIAEQSTKCVHDFARSVTWAVGKVMNSRNST